jgi:hypothetical protein
MEAVPQLPKPEDGEWKPSRSHIALVILSCVAALMVYRGQQIGATDSTISLVGGCILFALCVIGFAVVRIRDEVIGALLRGRKESPRPPENQSGPSDPAGSGR